MGSASVRLSGRKVLCSGSLIAAKGEAITLCPFDDWPNETLVFRVEIETDEAYTSKTEIDDTGQVNITYRRPWNQGLASINFGTSFEVDSSPQEYGIRFSVGFVGNPTQYMTLFHYTIFEGGDDV